MSGYNQTAEPGGMSPIAAHAWNLITDLQRQDIARVRAAQDAETGTPPDDDTQLACVPESYMHPSRDEQIETAIQMVTGHDAFIAAILEHVKALQAREEQHHRALAHQGQLIRKLTTELVRLTRIINATLDEQGKAFGAIGDLEETVGQMQATQASPKAA